MLNFHYGETEELICKSLEEKCTLRCAWLLADHVCSDRNRTLQIESRVAITESGTMLRIFGWPGARKVCRVGRHCDLWTKKRKNCRRM